MPQITQDQITALINAKNQKDFRAAFKAFIPSNIVLSQSNMINDVNCTFLAHCLMHDDRIDFAAVGAILTHLHDFDESGAQKLLNRCERFVNTRLGGVPKRAPQEKKDALDNVRRVLFSPQTSPSAAKPKTINRIIIEKLIRDCDSADLWKALKDKVQAYVNQELKKPHSKIAATIPQSSDLSQNKAIVAYVRTFHKSDQWDGGPGLLGKMVEYESSLGNLTKVCGGVAEGCENDESYDDLKEQVRAGVAKIHEMGLDRVQGMPELEQEKMASKLARIDNDIDGFLNQSQSPTPQL